MSKRVSATDAKNNFGGLLEDVAGSGRVEILKHGRLVAVILSPAALDMLERRGAQTGRDASWGEKHMIPAENARAARLLSTPSLFDEE